MPENKLDRFNITSTELIEAFKEFDRLNLRELNYSSQGSVVSVMGRYTGESPMISAGCETGIKLGLLIAEARQRIVEEIKRH